MKLAVQKRLHPEIVDFDNGYNHNNGLDDHNGDINKHQDMNKNSLHLGHQKSVQVYFDS